MTCDQPTDENPDARAAETGVSLEPGGLEGSRNHPRHTFPVVGLGASAGGLEALKAFFANVSETSGMAYIVVVHLSPKQPSLLPELLQRQSPIPVAVATDGEPLAPNHVYVGPPSKEVNVYRGAIQLFDLAERNLAPPIDSFFRSLAKDRAPDVAAIILSGTGSDGSQGIREIKSCEGLVVVQSEASAKYDGMPRSAIDTGEVDIIAAPEEMPAKLVEFFEHRGAARKNTLAAPAADRPDWLNKVFALLRSRVGHDFSAYKRNTILRRVSRRMGLHQIDAHDQYIRFLKENPQELDALFRELLIGVTSFFRDADSFEVLKRNVLPSLLGQLPQGATFRAWIPGCSTGEEAYSLAIALRECLESVPRQIHLQLFGTDIDSEAVEAARRGLYPASIAADMGSERLSRFFTREGDFYRIRKDIRDQIVFSAQDVLSDPPFSRLNLLCCRNLLIYFEAEAQRKLLPLFHYTLKSGGVLVLGSSESIGGFTDLFETVDNKWKIFRRRDTTPTCRLQFEFPTGLATEAAAPDGAEAKPPEPVKRSFARLAQEAILARFSPTSVLVDAKGNILHVEGRTGKYLETPSGPPTHNILDMAREGLRIELSSAIRAAIASNQPVARRGIRVQTNGDEQRVNLHVAPLHAPKDLAGSLLVVFQDAAATPEAAVLAEGQPGLPADERDTRIAEVAQELQSMRESHQGIVEELESANEELKSTNEELQSSNEELQSSNEELESSKEELQSLNEELQTVNAELQSKVSELVAAHDDMRNLLNSTHVATVFVDNQLRIRRFTEEAVSILNVIQTDVGRPLRHLTTNLEYDELLEDVARVLKELIPRHTEVRTKDERWYSCSILPYRTNDNRIDGAVLTFADVTTQKTVQEQLERTEKRLREEQAFSRDIVDTVREPLLVLDREFRVVSANRSYYETFQMDADQTVGKLLFELGNGQWEIPELRRRLEEVLPKNTEFLGFEVHHSFPQMGERRMLISAREIARELGKARLILLTIADLTS